MLQNRIYLLSLLIIFCIQIFAQQQKKHEKRIFISPSGRFFINKALPVYLSLSTSKGANAKQYQLFSEQNKDLTDPVKFQTEGYNPIRVTPFEDPNTRTKKMLNLDVYVDGLPPLTTSKITAAKDFAVQTKTIYGKNLQITLIGKDENSGVENTYYSINGAAYVEYKDVIKIDKEGDFSIKYYSADNVGNVEKPKELNFSVDISAPETTYKVEGEQLKEILSAKSKIILERKDNMTGVLKTSYSLDGSELRTYVQPLSFETMTDGEHTLTFFSLDNVGNIEDKAKPGNTFKFYLDRKSPDVEIKLEGDEFQSGPNLFISGRTKINIESKDNHSGIDQVIYQIKGSRPDVPITGVQPTPYTQPFVIAEKGPQMIIVTATDKIGNSRNKTLKIYVDNDIPRTGIKYAKPQTFSTEMSILCITSKTKISLFTTQFDSGVKSTKYSIDGGAEKPYGEPFTITKEGKHKIQFATIDNVNNEEKMKTSWLLVDDTPPNVDIRFPTPAKKKTLNTGKVIDAYPPRSRMYLDTKDAYSGVKRIIFSINGGNPIDYEKTSSAVMEELFMDEKYYSVKAEVTDKLGNTGIKVFEFIIAK